MEVAKSPMFALVCVLLAVLTVTVEVDGFSTAGRQQRTTAKVSLSAEMQSESCDSQRRDLFGSILCAGGASVLNPLTAMAETKRTQVPLEDYLYRIVRVREATTQESRLIKSGKFKDVQRANVKLAVRFMLQNYRLGDAFVQSSAFLDGTDRRLQAGQVGQSVVQNLQTILEYFDSSDVQNLKVGTNDNMAGKETLVLRGLDSSRKGIDDFLAFFPAAEVDAVKKRVESENELNVKEFDSSLGNILNMPPPS